MNDLPSMTYEIVSKRRNNSPNPIYSPEDAYCLLKHFYSAKKEHFIVITLNGSHLPITVSIISIGIANRTIVHPREVFIKAIEDRAIAIIVCHNHPSGSLKPSPEDNEITERLYEAGKVIGINVLDHIIFSRNGYASLRKEGYFTFNGDA